MADIVDLVKSAYKDGLKERDELIMYLSEDEMNEVIKEVFDLTDHHVVHVKVNHNMFGIKLKRSVE